LSAHGKFYIAQTCTAVTLTDFSLDLVNFIVAFSDLSFSNFLQIFVN